MFDAQALITSNSIEIFSPWMPRGGDLARFTLDAISFGQTGGGVAELSVRAFTKNTQDTGDGADADTSVSIVRTTEGRTTAEWASTASTGFKELVRYKFTLTNNSDVGTVWALFRMLTPVWFDAVRT